MITALSVTLLAVPARAEGKATWVVDGAGFGHGVGMSAYGALGFGKHGYGARRILDHYFRGIDIESPGRSRRVRVLLELSGGDVTFSEASNACGRRLDPARTYAARRAGSRVKLLSGSGSTLARCGERLHARPSGRIEIGGVGTFRGALDVTPAGGGGLNVINDLSADDYVQGVLPVEIFPSWPRATLEAFAIASRSIGLSSDVGSRDFDVYADTRSQVYEGLEVETERTNQAVRATLGEVATYEGAIAQTTYFSASGGRTESGFLGAPEVPYLKSVRDPYDDLSPLHRWTRRFSQAEMDALLGGYVEGRLMRIRVTKRGDSPRIDEAELVGTRGTTTVRGDTIQAALGLPDRWAFFEKR